MAEHIVAEYEYDEAAGCEVLVHRPMTDDELAERAALEQEVEEQRAREANAETIRTRLEQQAETIRAGLEGIQGGTLFQGTRFTNPERSYLRAVGRATLAQIRLELRQLDESVE